METNLLYGDSRLNRLPSKFLKRLTPSEKKSIKDLIFKAYDEGFEDGAESIEAEQEITKMSITDIDLISESILTLFKPKLKPDSEKYIAEYLPLYDLLKELLDPWR